LQAQILGNHPATAKFNLQLKQARESGSNTIPCVVCDGQRVFKVATFGGNNVHPCPGCNMNGFRPYFERDAELPQGPVSISCPTCGGSGEFSGVGDFFTMACPSCGGKGQLRVSD
jgi:DnaJ-class molecular chaperone